MQTRAIRKMLISNRGEIAVRIMRTCKEMGISTVAVFSDADRVMPHVLMADEAYHIGPSPSRESYLVMEKIIGIAKQAGVDAIHPGYGFLSENDQFAQHVRDQGLIFVGPTAESVRTMGDKTRARALIKKAGLPIVPGTVNPIANEDEAKSFFNSHGFPVLIKAAAGGGGKGMRVVRNLEEFPSLWRAARGEAGSAFGDDRVYLEKYLENPRHIEFQILGDEFGNVVHLGERECSIQRRHQKVVEETPSVIVDDAMRLRMGEAAVQAAKACRYVNAGTMEFLVDRSKNFYFLEMNTRLQVEHPVTEMRTGIDIVAQQIRIAMGEALDLKQEDIRFNGHAIECRIYAEDPANNFMPSTGTITRLRPASGFGVREDRGIEEGQEVSVYYDPMIAKLIVWGRSRTEAMNRMKRALRDYEIVGVETNIPLNLFVLQHPQFVSGNFDTHFIAENWKSGFREDLDGNEVLAAAAVAALVSAKDPMKAATLEKTGANGATVHTAGNSMPKPAKSWKHQRIHSMRER